MDDSSLNDMRAHAEGTVGGWRGHVLRRMFHLSMLVIPLIYYWHGNSLSDWVAQLIGVKVSRDTLVYLILALVIICESVRLWTGFVIFGQREYEAKQISALAWGGASVCICLLYAPRGGYNGAYIGLPIIYTLSLVDPVLGECRRYLESSNLVILLGLLTAASVWALSSVFLGTPFWLVLLMAPISVAAEWPSLKQIDDNGMLVLVPLCFSLLLQPLF